VLPDDLQEHRSLLSPDSVVFLDGTVDSRREEPALRVSRIIPIADAAEEFAKKLVIQLPDEAVLAELLDLLKEHRGACEVYIEVETAGGFVAQVQCGPGVRVACKQSFLSQAVGLLGRNRIAAYVRSGRSLPLGDLKEMAPRSLPAAVV
jgi:hypothetical protein